MKKQGAHSKQDSFAEGSIMADDEDSGTYEKPR